MAVICLALLLFGATVALPSHTDMNAWKHLVAQCSAAYKAFDNTMTVISSTNVGGVDSGWYRWKWRYNVGCSANCPSGGHVSEHVGNLANPNSPVPTCRNKLLERCGVSAPDVVCREVTSRCAPLLPQDGLDKIQAHCTHIQQHWRPKVNWVSTLHPGYKIAASAILGALTGGLAIAPLTGAAVAEAAIVGAITSAFASSKTGRIGIDVTIPIPTSSSPLRQENPSFDFDFDSSPAPDDCPPPPQDEHAPKPFSGMKFGTGSMWWANGKAQLSPSGEKYLREKGAFGTSRLSSYLEKAQKSEVENDAEYFRIHRNWCSWVSVVEGIRPNGDPSDLPTVEFDHMFSTLRKHTTTESSG